MVKMLAEHSKEEELPTATVWPVVASKLVVVVVAQEAALGVHDLVERDALRQAHAAQHVVERGRLAVVAAVLRRGAADRVGPGAGVGALPDAVVAVDEGVVQEEDGVLRRRLHVGHDPTDGVVAVRVGAQERAVVHVLKVVVRVARVDEARRDRRARLLVDAARQAVLRVRAAGTDIELHVGELLHLRLVASRRLGKRSYSLRW